MSFDPMTEMKGVDSPTTNTWVKSTGHSIARRDWNLSSAIDHGYKTYVWAYVCGARLSENVGQFPWIVVDGKKQKIDGHQAAALVENPNESQSRSEQMAIRTLHLLLGGDSFDKIVFTGPESKQVASELWTMNPDVTDVVTGDESWIDHYRITPKSGGVDDLPANAVVHAKFVDPGNPFRGLSPLRSVGADVDMDKAATVSNRELVENALNPTGIYSSTDIKSPEDAKIIRKMLKDKAGPGSSGEPVVVGLGASYKQLGLRPADMNYLELSTVSLMRVCAAFGMMGQMFLNDGSALQQGAMRAFIRYEWAVGTMRVAMKISAALTQRLLTREERLAGLRIIPDTTEVEELRPDITEATQGFERLTRNGVPSQMAAGVVRINVGELPDGDQAYRTTNVEPVGSNPGE